MERRVFKDKRTGELYQPVPGSAWEKKLIESDQHVEEPEDGKSASSKEPKAT